MYNSTDFYRKYSVKFHGKGFDYFKIAVINFVLTAVSLGLYYPWAKEKSLKFFLGQTSLENNKFAFHGTGKEMFKGFIKTLIIFFILYGIFGLLLYLQYPGIAMLVLYLGLFALIPFAIHGGYKYRMSRTTWRGIRFGYRGDRLELFKKFTIGIILTVLTLGVYGSWFTINLRKYIIDNIRLGNLKFKYNGNGLGFLLLNIKGIIFSILTLGIYSFWYQKDLFNYYIDNISIEGPDKKYMNFRSNVSGRHIIFLSITNILIIIFTLGIGFPWVITRTLNTLLGKIILEGNIDLDAIAQTEQDYKDATGEDTADILDIDLFI